MTGSESAVAIKAVLTAILLSIGIAAPLPDALGGMSLCIAGAYAAMLITPPEQRGTTRATLIVAIVVGIGVAILHGSVGWLGAFRFPLTMLLAGALSRWIVQAVAAFGRGLVDRAGTVPGSIKLPWEK